MGNQTMTERVLNAQSGVEILTRQHSLKVLATIEGTGTDEENLHNRFADLSVRREWFPLTSRLKEHFGLFDVAELLEKRWAERAQGRHRS